MQSDVKYIPVVFDKNHLLTIGERLYSTSLDLVRELVSNAYDADATIVRITVQPETITIEDNGNGMDEDRLCQYFTIGSQEKKLHNISPKLGRKRVGEFGIGKFSVLTIAERFYIETQQAEKQFHAELLFDAAEWTQDPYSWHVPCTVVPYDPSRASGTRITITKLKKSLEPSKVVRVVRERLPLGREDFRIFVNGSEVTATSIPGKRFPVHFETPFGAVDGEIILAHVPTARENIAEAGITIRVKQIAVTKSLFGYGTSHAIGVGRLRGFINADFLPITSSRDNVIQDTDEYRIVHEEMRSALRNVLREAKNIMYQKENSRASEVLRDALDRIGRAFKKNPDILGNPAVEPPLGEATHGFGKEEEGYRISKAQFVDAGIPLQPFEGSSPLSASLNADAKPPPRRRHAILANKAIIRRMNFRNLGLVCRMERFGNGYPLSFREQGIIFVNIDHPLYRKQAENPALMIFFVSSLITKEIALEKHPHDAHEAYALQYKLLTDAFKDARVV
jgi:hypothetical protein